MEALRHVLAVLVGFGSGVLVSGAVFAFISVIGVVPRMAQKTRTEPYVKHYESAITFGGVFGALGALFSLQFPLGGAFLVVMALCVGVFIGVLAMSLAEVLNVLPILARRIHLQKGMFYFVLAIALGKMVGALLYAVVPGFFTTE